MDNDFLDTDTFTWPTGRRFSTGPLRLLNNLNIPEPDALGSDRPRSILRDVSDPIPQFVNDHLYSLRTSQRSDWTKVDPRGLDFVTPPNESLLCAICSAPFIKPTELGCEHVFCEECLYEHLTSGIASATKCPKCRTPIDSINSAPKLLSQLLDDLEVQCPNSSEGCKKELKRYTVNAHVANYCDFEDVACSKTNCFHNIPRRLAHMECLHTYTECETCNQFIMEKDMDDHERKSCPVSGQDCPYCHQNFRRAELESHQLDDCPMVPIHCPGQVVGCTFQDVRMTVNEHAISCPIAAMRAYLEEMNVRQTALQEENEKLRSRVADLDSRIEKMEEDFSKLSDDLKKERRRSVMMQTPASASRMEEIASRIEEVSAEHNSRLDNATSESARLHMAWMNDSLRTTQQFHTINATIAALRTQVSHVANISRAGSGGNPGSASSGASAGGGVSLDSIRREPPKL